MVEGHVGKDKIQLLNQALNAASSSLNLAKQLLTEIEHRSGTPEMPGLVGKYDGMFMVTEAGKKYPVPDNYSAKTKLVYGDKLKMIEGPEGRRFKLLEEMERVEEEAQLVVKDGHFEALTKGGSYKLIQGAVRYWSGEEGDKIKILLPKGGRNVPFAGLVEIIGRKPGEGVPEEQKPKVEPRREEPKREEPKREEKVEEKKAPDPDNRASARLQEKPVEKTAPAKKEEEKPAPKAPDNRASARLLGLRSEPSKEDKKEEPAKKPAVPASKSPKPMDEEDLR